MRMLCTGLLAFIGALALSSSARAADIVHDAEYYILEAQNGTRWAVEDGEIDAKLAELRAKYGRPPNIVHFMWDDQPLGAVGVKACWTIWPIAAGMASTCRASTNSPPRI